MTTRYEEIEVVDGLLHGKRDGYNFRASFNLLLIGLAQERGCGFEDLADGFGPGAGTHGDWSAIRDSSEEAKNQMLERSLNHLFGEG